MNWFILRIQQVSVFLLSDWLLIYSRHHADKIFNYFYSKGYHRQTSPVQCWFKTISLLLPYYDVAKCWSFLDKLAILLVIGWFKNSKLSPRRQRTTFMSYKMRFSLFKLLETYQIWICLSPTFLIVNIINVVQWNIFCDMTWNHADQVIVQQSNV